MASSRIPASAENCLNLFANSKSPTNKRNAPGRRTLLQTKAVIRCLIMLILGSSAHFSVQAQTAYFSGAVTSLGGGAFYYTYGVAVDQSGNVYVADEGHDAVREMPPGCMSQSCVTTLGGNWDAPRGVAVDASGNVYVADSLHDEIEEMSPGCTTDVYNSVGCTIQSLGGGFSEPFGVAVDNSGNVYVADTGSGLVKEMPAGCTSYICVTTLGQSGGFPVGVAVDTSGNVYVGDQSLGLYEMPPNCTAVNFQAQACAATKLGGGYQGQGVAVDGSGNVYLAALFVSAVVKMPPNCTSASCVTPLGGGFGAPTGVAVDSSGNVYIGIQSNPSVQEISPQGVNFGTVAVGSTSPAQTLYFTFTAPDSGITASVVTQGAKGLDFVDAATGTCDTNGTNYTYVAYPNVTSYFSYNCSVNVTFSPKYAGARYGAVQLSDATGVIATAYIYGTGEGPQIAYGTSAGTAIAPVVNDLGLNEPNAMVFDGAGNLYIADGNNNRVLEVPASGGAVTSIDPVVNGAGLYGPGGLAVDGAGDLFIPDFQHERVLEVPAAGGAPIAIAPVVNGIALGQVYGAAFDGAGDLFLSDTSNSRIVEIPAGGGTPIAIRPSVGLGLPYAIAVDGAGDLFVVDQYYNRVVQMPAGGGTPILINPTVNGITLNGATGLALDSAGDLFIADVVNNRVVEVSAGSGVATALDPTVNGVGLHYPVGVALDPAGDLFIADAGNNRLVEIQRSQPPPLNFAATNVGAASSDSPQTLTLQNIGNAPLSFSIPATGENPSLSAGFTLDPATTCPEVLTSSSPGTLAAGATCSLAVDFIPATAGAINGTAVLTDNNLNAGNAAQQILLSGTGVGQTTPTITWATPVAITYGTPLSSTQLDAAASVGGTFVYSPPAGTLLNAGMQTLSVTLTPNDTSDYTTANASVILQVNMAPQTITFAPLPATQQGGTLSLSATGGTSGNPVTFTSLTPGVCSVLNTTATLTSPGTCTIQANQAGNANYVAAIPVSQSVINTAALGFGPVPVGTSSATQTVTLSPPGGSSLASIAVVTQGAANLDFANAGGGTCVPSLARFASGATCTVNVTFTPPYAGVRYGAVVLTDGGGNVLATANVYGIGSGPEVAYGTASATAIAPVVNGTSLSFPNAVVQDGSGNIFISDEGNNRVIKIAADGGAATAITPVANGEGLYAPFGMAVDGAGDLFIADFQHSRVVEVPASGAPPIALAPTVYGYPIGQISGVAMDSAGDLFLTDSQNSRLVEMPAGGGAATVVYSSVQLEDPRQVAVDAAGDLFVGNQDINSVVEIPAGGGAAVAISPIVNGKGLISPDGVAVDAAGDLFIADFGNNRVVEVPAGGGAASAIDPTVNGLGLSHPISVAVDGSGDLFIADEGNNRVVEIQRSQPPAFNFAITNVGATSSDSPQTVMLENIGNAPLTLPAPGMGENPSISAGFALDPTTTCPEVLTSSSPGTLAAGATCSLAVDFIPTSAGAINGSVVLTDNNLNVSPAMQTINLSGTGLISTVSVSIGTNPAGLSFSINGTPYSTTQTPSLAIGSQYTLSTTSPQAGGPGVQYVFSQWSDGTMSLTEQLTPTAGTSSDTAQFTAQYMLTVTAGSGGTIGASTAPNAFYNPATVQPISATPNAGYYFVGWTGANSPGDIASATSATTSVTMNGPENLIANFAPIPTFQVTTLNDDAIGNAADCTTPSPNCSLRDAITAIQANDGSTGTITFAPGLNGTITLTSALPSLNGQMTITGPGAGSLTISGGNSLAVGSVLTLNPGATVAVSGVTITGGNSVNGGAITNNGSLTVSNSTLSGNTGGCGGAICNLIGVAQSAGVGTLTLSGSTISGNRANFNGGAIVNSGTLTVIDSTISGNSAGYVFGGGIYNANGALTVVDSTISGNASGQYGGGIFNAAIVTISNSIVAGNTASGNPGDDCDRCGNQSSNNLITTPGNIINPNLGALGNYGGPTQTMLPLPGSAAICAASSALIPAGVNTDQRGFSNFTTYNGTQCYDLGAVQTNYALGFSANQEPPSTGTLPSLAMSPSPAVTLTENGNPLTTGAAIVNLTDMNSDLTTSPATASTSVGNGQAAFSTLIFTGPTSGDTLIASLALNPNNVGLNITATSTSFSVAAGTPAVIWPTASPISYGQMLGSSTLSGGSASFGNTPVLGSFAFSNPSTLPGAGTQTENITFTPTNTSAYNSVSGTVSVLVNKAMPTVTFTGAPANAPYGATFMVAATTNANTTAVITASGSCSIAGTTVTISASSGTCSLSATWAADNNYVAASATQSTMATKATPLITWATPAAITYGTALSATQLDATATYNGSSVAGKFVYTPAKGTVLAAGSQTLSVTFTPTNTIDYANASASVTLQVNQAMPKITWAKPAAITYGTALSSTQLDATTTVAGTLVYSPAAGTVLDAGTQTLSVTFTPTDTIDYTTATDSVTITITKATVVITWATPAPIVYGIALSSTQLDATASVPGTFVYSPALGAVEPAGADKLSVTFTPADTVDYSTATASVTLQVNAAAPVINWSTPAAITYGTALSGTQLNATATNAGATVAGTFVYAPAKGTVLGAGNQTLSVTFTPSNTTNFTSASASVVLQVNQATPKITWAKPAVITYGTALSSTQLDATASVPGTLVYSPAAGAVLAGGTETLSVTFSPTDAVDYTTATASVSISVTPTTSTTTITTNTPDPSVVGQSVLVSFSASGANGVPTGTVTVTASTGQSCIGTLIGGTGSCALTFTAIGSPKLTAVYSGDNNFKTSSSVRVTQTVQ